MAEGFSRGRPGPSTHTSGSGSTDAALSLHNLIDRTCGKINELKQLMIDECNLLHQDFSDELMEPILARQDYVIQRAMKCIQVQQKAITSSTDNNLGFSRRSDRRLIPPLNNVSAEPPKHVTINDPRLHQSGFDEIDSSAPIKEKKKWRLGLGKEKKKDILMQPNPVGGVANNNPTVTAGSSVTPHQGEMKDVENSAWYGSLDRNFAKKKKRPGLDKSRRHTKTVGSMAGLDIAERCEKLRPDEHYEIGLPNIAIQRGSTPHVVSLNKNRPPLPSPYFTGNSEPPPRPVPKKDVLFGPNIVKEQQINRISPVDINFGSHISTPSPLGYPKSATMGMASPDWFRTSTMIPKNSSLSKSWFETNLDEGKLSSQSTLSLASHSVLEPSTSMSVIGVDPIGDGNINRMYIASPGTDISEKSSKSSDSETRCSFTNESSKPFEMSDYYKYSTKFRSQSASVLPQDNLSSSGRSNIRTAFGDQNQLKKGRVVAVNVNDELRFTVEETVDNDDDANGNYYNHNPPVPKLPPKQPSFNGPRPAVSKTLVDPMENSDMTWFLDFDPPTFV